jgi:TetR/AcrR family transcriptional regulator, transcriptional repressor for nem operon
MAREKQFSEAEVLERVADVFAAHGYQGTSLSMLLEATGLGKQSLYNTFGDKRALYLESVECAVARYAALLAAMQAAPNGRAAIAAYFDALIGHCAGSDTDRQSCILTAGLLEGVEDERIAHRLRDKWTAMHEVLRAAVERGQKDGSIRSQAPSSELADLLLAVVGGMRVNSRAAMDRRRLQRTAGLALSLLDRDGPLPAPS